ncbi:MAG TPA: transketolase [Acidobacteriota bacterium]|nr:transketolase [Acidobacteriota bacterium]
MNHQTAAKSATLSEARAQALQVMANRLRRHSLLSTAEAASGHPSTCFSCAEIVATVFFQFLRYDLQNPRSPYNDRFVLSKGHGAPILWAVLAEAGAFPVEELKNLRKIDSTLEGHPTPRSPYVDVATGSLGQGLSNALGMALAANLDGLGNKIYALLGDGETAEGAVWEAAALASHRKLDNFIAILDVNRLGQSDPTMYQHRIEEYDNRFRAFGWKTYTLDGHSVPEIAARLQDALQSEGQPVILIARTFKGKGVSFMENREGWHGKPVTDPDQLRQALQEIGENLELTEDLSLAKPENTGQAPRQSTAEIEPPNYDSSDRVATRLAYGTGLRKLGAARSEVVALDADVKNSTYSEKFAEAFPERFFDFYIAEQNMVGAAAGMSALGKIPFASSFACFLSRAYDFIRMSAISQANLKLCGSHAGVSIGADGPSQMALEDLAMMRAVQGSTVLYPSDAVCAEKLLPLAADAPGIVYIRTSRPKTAILYSNDETFEIGGSKVLRSSPEDRAVVVSAGVTLHEALEAYEQLRGEGVPIRIIDLYCVKPIDQETLRAAAEETGAVVTVEDHYPEGGLGEAVRMAISGIDCRFRQIAVNGLPRSGKSEELMDLFGISAARIAESVRKLVDG